MNAAYITAKAHAVALSCKTIDHFNVFDKYIDLAQAQIKELPYWYGYTKKLEDLKWKTWNRITGTLNNKEN